MIEDEIVVSAAGGKHRVLAAKCRRKFHLDAHIPPDALMLCDDFSAAEFVHGIIATGADSVCVFSKCHYGYSYYPTEIGHPHPGLKIDLLGTLAREFKRQAPKMPVFVYYNLRFSPVDSNLHREWTITKPTDASQEVEAGHLATMWLQMCFNTPYGEVVRGQFAEIARRYPIDGFFVDFSRSAGACHCRWCRGKYLNETGGEIPLSPDDPGFAAYAEWQRRDSDRFINELATEMQKIRPEISIGSNYCYGLRHPLPPDDAIGYLSEDVLERDNAPGFYESLDGRYYCSLDIPAEIMITRMSNWWTDWGFKNDDQLFLQNAVISALGLNIDLSDELYPNYKIPPRVFSIFRRVFSRAEKSRAIMEGAISAPDALILHTASSYYNVPRAENDNAAALSSIRGIHSILLQSRFHYQIVSESVLAQWLGRAKLLILPDQAALDTMTVRLIKDFVLTGGTILGFGDTLQVKALEEVFGVEFEGKFDTPHQFLSAEPFIDYEGEDFPVMVRGACTKLRPVGARIISGLLEGKFSVEGFCHGHPLGPVRYPGITENHYGGGRAVAIAAPVGRSMDIRPYPELRRLILGIVGTLAENSFVVAKSHENVEVTHFRRGVVDIVHLINHPLKLYSNSRYAIEKIDAIKGFEVKFSVSSSPKAVYLEDRGTTVEWAWENGTLTVRLNEFHIHNIIIIEAA